MPRNNHLLPWTAFFLILLHSMPSLSQTRERIPLTQKWIFVAGDTVNGQPISAKDIPAQGGVEVNLPHDFQISQPWVEPSADEKPDESDAAANVKSRLSARGFKEMGSGWYFHRFRPDPSWRKRRVMLDVEGIMLVGDAYLNGQPIGGTDYGYLGFESELSDKLLWEGDNLLAIRADTRRPENSRWYTGGGLFRPVSILVTDPQLHFTRHPLYITTPEASTEEALIAIQAEITCLLRTDSLTVDVEIADQKGHTVYACTRRIRFNRGQKTCEHPVDSIRLPHPMLWSPRQPHLYHARLTLRRPDGTAADSFTQRFGIRTLSYSPQYGLRVNGEKTLLQGMAGHNTLGPLGAAAYPRAIEKQLRMLKAFGVNHVRTSHNPYSQVFMDLCDSLGILVVDELYDKWLTQYAGGRTPWVNLWQHDVPEWVKRDRNHPSVVMWSLGNELQTYWSLPFADWGVTPYRLQRELIHRFDTTRPITVAMHPRGRHPDTDSLPAPLVMETDVASYNYRYMYFPGDGRRFPHLTFYQSEASTSAMGANFFEMDLDRVIGLAYWGMIDYLGESAGWPAKGWTQGMFDITLCPKPAAWHLRSYFKPEEPVVHLAVEEGKDNTLWNDVRVGTARLTDHWNRKEGSLLTLYTFTNAEEVELKVCGKSMGVKANDKNARTRNKIKWERIPYKAGSIEAIARTRGKVVARHRVETAGKAHSLTATADTLPWMADAQDLKYIRITAADRQGRTVPSCTADVKFTVDGPAQLVAVAGGDMYSSESYVADHRRLFQGQACLILRSTGEPGAVKIQARAEGLKPATLTLHPGTPPQRP